MKPLPLPKKYYPIDLTLFQTSHRNYLMRLNLSNLYVISNKYSTIDGLINSGSTTIPIEYKNRDSLSVAAYDSCMIEKQKYNSLLTLKSSIDAPFSLYVVEYKDCILVYSLTGNEHMKWESMPVNGDMKEVCLMPYSMASYCISKHSRQLRTTEHLMHYINSKQEQCYNITVNDVMHSA